MSLTIDGKTYVLVDAGTATEIWQEEDGGRVIEVQVPGAQGPVGPPGPSGASFNFVQSIATTTWTINHNLGFQPVVQTRTPGGLHMWGQVQHLSLNVVQVTFTEATTGTARLT